MDPKGARWRSQPASSTAPIEPMYSRVLLKLGGEMFGGGQVGLDPDVVALVARQIAEVVRSGAQVAVVIGGGNFFRGAQLQQRGMERTRSDYMGMLGTVMNSLALQDFLEKEGIDDARSDRDHDGSGRRALHSAARPPAPREGARRHLRRGHGAAVLLHRHHRRATGAGDRRRGGADGQGRRRRLHRRPAHEPERRAAHRDHPPRGHRPRAPGRRRHRVQPLHGQRHAHPGVQSAHRWKYRACGRR